MNTAMRKNDNKHRQTRWLYCVECPQYSTRRRSASNIRRSSMQRKNRFVSDIAIFALKRDVKLQLTNVKTGRYGKT